MELVIETLNSTYVIRADGNVQRNGKTIGALKRGMKFRIGEVFTFYLDTNQPHIAPDPGNWDTGLVRTSLIKSVTGGIL